MMRYLWMVLLVIVVGGCVPYSDHPLTEPDKGAMDSSLCGTWFFRDGDEAVYLHLGRDGKSKLLRVIMLDYRQDGDLEMSEFSGHTSQVGEKRYLNLRWVQPAVEQTGYLFVRYVVDEDRLGISLMDLDAVEGAIEKGALKGEVIREQWVSSVRIQEGSDRLRRFFLLNEDTLFKETQYLQRLELPDLLAAGEEDGRPVSVEALPEYLEKAYRVGVGECRIEWRVLESEVNRGIIQNRSACALPLRNQLPLLAKVLARILEDEALSGPFHTLFWGRLKPDGHESSGEMSLRLALAAAGSPLWDKERGKPVTGHENAFIVTVANEAGIYRELEQLFRQLGRTVKFASAEKVLITEAAKLPFFAELEKQGVRPTDRLPIDCLTWFSIEKPAR